jgi:hypothetical protein
MNSNYADVMAASKSERDELKARLDAELKRKWDSMLEDRKVTSQRAIVALVNFMVNEDPAVQAMILEHIPDGDMEALSKIVLKRLAEKAKAKKK